MGPSRMNGWPSGKSGIQRCSGAGGVVGGALNGRCLPATVFGDRDHEFAFGGIAAGIGGDHDHARDAKLEFEIFWQGCCHIGSATGIDRQGIIPFDDRFAMFVRRHGYRRRTIGYCGRGVVFEHDVLCTRSVELRVVGIRCRPRAKYCIRTNVRMYDRIMVR